VGGFFVYKDIFQLKIVKEKEVEEKPAKK